MIDIIDGVLRISVRNLVEFLCREGNLDGRFKGVTDKTAMEAGSRIHKKIQKSSGPDYQAEYFLSNTFGGEEYDVIIEGRADGVFFEDDCVYIDEIKGTYKDVRYMSEPITVHKAQAMCYAYIYSKQNSLLKTGVRMTYVNLVSEDIKYFEEVFSFEQLSNWMDDIVLKLRKWGDYVISHKKERNNSIADISFPFEYRPGQRNLAVSVYKSIENSKCLFIQAPTGVGKTISTVFPSVKAIGNNMGSKLFYLTAKTITRTAAQDAFGIMREQGLIFTTVTITAKEKICLLESETGPECNPEVCMYAKGHFDRVNDAVYDLITTENVITRDTIIRYAVKHSVCPFEMCLDVTYWTDGIICDYNYVFDPEVRLKRYFAESNRGDYIFLIDEAHNLVDRAREMFSADIYKDRILEIKRLVAPYSKKLEASLGKCNRNLLTHKRECADEYMELKPDMLLYSNMKKLESDISEFMENNRDFEYGRELADFYFDVLHFNNICTLADDNYVTYCEHTDDGFMYRLFCVNPGNNIRQCIDRGRMGVFFSATLLPINYYKELLLGNTEENAIYAQSPFDVNKRLIVIGRDVTSRYNKRNLDEYTKIKEYICKITDGRKGNYLVFFPSYKYMDEVRQLFDEENFNILVQEGGMTEEDKEVFLSNFSKNRDSTLVGFCVMGGVFSEGIDLKNDSLIGSIIIGPGLPTVSVTCNILKDYYDRKENRGFEYAYVYPGMNKVLQAAGRVIRTDEDMGVIALLDERFLQDTYRNLFPREWDNYIAVERNNVREEVLDFWSNMIYNITESVD